MNGGTLDRQRLYRQVSGEERYFVTDHQRRTAFYVGLLVALFSGTVTGIWAFRNDWHYSLMTALGPFSIIAVSWLTKKSSARAYQRFLEAVVLKAKLEEDLGMNSSRRAGSDDWVQAEPYVGLRHREGRHGESYVRSSFYEWRDDGGVSWTHRILRSVFRSTQSKKPKLVRKSWRRWVWRRVFRLKEDWSPSHPFASSRDFVEFHLKEFREGYHSVVKRLCCYAISLAVLLLVPIGYSVWKGLAKPNCNKDSNLPRVVTRDDLGAFVLSAWGQRHTHG